MKVITLLNEKGGVCKTTLSTTLAAGLAIRGERVLVIDSDPQGHATVSMGFPKRDGLLRLLAQDEDWDDLTLTVPADVWAGPYAEVESDQKLGVVYLLPSHLNNRALPMLLDGNFLYLAQRLDEVADQVDYVVIDTSPTPSMVHGLVHLATDHILFPTQLEYLSLDGLQSSFGNMKSGNRARERFGMGPINLLGIVPVMVEENTNNHKNNKSMTVDHFGDVMLWQSIHKRTIWRQASQAGRSIFAYAAGHRAELEAWSLVNRVYEEIA